MMIEYEYKEMCYFGEMLIEPIILFEGKYKDYQFYILNLGTHPTAYVEIPKGHPFYRKDYNRGGVEDFITCHGGLTYSSNKLANIKENSWFIGWDYAHYDDYSGFYEGMEFKSFNVDELKRWTTEEIYEEVQNVINQLREIDFNWKYKEVPTKKITRKDGIKYERKEKEKKYDTNITIRFETDKLEILKKLADKEGIKYTKLVRNIVNEYIERNS